MADHRQLYVLCDTNAAVRDAHLFRKRDGRALIAMLRAKNAKLVVPDVLRLEYITQFIEAGNQALSKATEGLDRLKTFCGYDMREILPSSPFQEAHALEILTELDDVIHTIPTTSELKIAAADRTMKGIRPTSKTDHGYKDCLIWESLLTLPKGSEVILLSRDEAAFFENGRLAPGLESEAKERGLKLTAYSTTKNPSTTLRPVLEALTSRFADIAASVPGDFPLDKHPMIQAYLHAQPLAATLPMLPPDEAAEPVLIEPGELETYIATQTKQFALIEIRALGFVSFLRNSGKQQMVDLLVRSGVRSEEASNALERLALARLITDTGHNYLATSGRQAEMAAQLVESEMIKLLETKG
jgi:hypothetical protein